jgi:hypothetical protein
MDILSNKSFDCKTTIILFKIQSKNDFIYKSIAIINPTLYNTLYEKYVTKPPIIKKIVKVNNIFPKKFSIFFFIFDNSIKE